MADKNGPQINFRTDEATRDGMQEWMAQRGLTTGQALEVILEILRSADAREAMPSRGAEIDNFHSLIKQVMTAYTASLEFAQNTEARIRDDYAKKIDSQADTIAALQEKVKKVQEDAALEKEKARTQAESLTTLTSEQADEIRNLRKQAAEAIELREKVETLTKQLADEKEKAIVEKDKAAFEEKKRAQEEISKIRESAQLAIEAAQKNVTEIQTKAQKTIDNVQAQYQKLYEELHKGK